MKLISVFILFFAQIAAANTLNYTCLADQGRQKGSKLVVKETVFNLSETRENDARVIAVDGTLYVQYDFNTEDGSLDEFYGGEFKITKLAENKKYRPIKYKNYSQFKEFNATKTTTVDGGGMWGYMVIEKNTAKPDFKAHYVFQAGDHMGGSIDFTCNQ